MFQELQTCSDVSRLLKKDGMCIEAGRRVPKKWFYTDRNAEEKNMDVICFSFVRAENIILLSAVFVKAQTCQMLNNFLVFLVK